MPATIRADAPLDVVAAHPAAAEGDALREHLRAFVVSWWIPDDFIFVDALLRTPGGKVDKRLLRERGRPVRSSRPG